MHMNRWNPRLKWLNGHPLWVWVAREGCWYWHHLSVGAWGTGCILSFLVHILLTCFVTRLSLVQFMLTNSWYWKINHGYMNDIIQHKIVTYHKGLLDQCPELFSNISYRWLWDHWFPVTNYHISIEVYSYSYLCLPLTGERDSTKDNFLGNGMAIKKDFFV